MKGPPDHDQTPAVEDSAAESASVTHDTAREPEPSPDVGSPAVHFRVKPDRRRTWTCLPPDQERRRVISR